MVTRSRKLNLEMDGNLKLIAPGRVAYNCKCEVGLN